MNYQVDVIPSEAGSDNKVHRHRISENLGDKYRFTWYVENNDVDIFWIHFHYSNHPLRNGNKSFTSITMNKAIRLANRKWWAVPKNSIQF